MATTRKPGQPPAPARKPDSTPGQGPKHGPRPDVLDYNERPSRRRDTIVTDVTDTLKPPPPPDKGGTKK